MYITIHRFTLYNTYFTKISNYEYKFAVQKKKNRKMQIKVGSDLIKAGDKTKTTDKIYIMGYVNCLQGGRYIDFKVSCEISLYF